MLLTLVSVALAGPDTTRDSLDRLEEVLQLRLDDGRLDKAALLPILLVSAEPHFADSKGWYTTRAVEVLQGAFGGTGLRLCEACMVPRTRAEDGQLAYQTGPIGLDEVVRLDEEHRGRATPARTAIWLDEHRGGVSIRMIDLRSSEVVFAQNIDPLLNEDRNTKRLYGLAEELERRHSGRGLTQAFVDIAVYPGQHISIDWTDQWGKTNANLSGLTLTVLDPVVGIGAVHYRRFDFFNVLVGAKAVVSVPTALVQALGADTELIDPIFTGVGVVRVPFGRSNYGAVATLSTNGTIGLGISLMNISLLPVIP